MQVTDEMVRVALDAEYAAHEHGDVGPSEASMRAALTAALAAMWRPIEEAPKDGESILLGFRGQMSAEGLWRDGSHNHWNLAGWYFADDDVLTGRPCEPDCFMPLPSPPTQTGG